MTDLRDIQKHEMELWERYHKKDDSEALSELLDSMEPIKQKWFNTVSNAPLPNSYLEARIKNQMIDSFKTYDPDKGAKLSTYVNSRMKKVYRDIYPYQNVGSIPEHRIIKIQTFKRVNEKLEDKLGREPNNLELSDELGWDLAEVERMNRELREGVISSPESEEYLELDDNFTSDKLDYVYYSLTPEEKGVFERLFGWGGKERKRPGEIQDILNLSPSQYRRIRGSIIEKIEKVI